MCMPVDGAGMGEPGCGARTQQTDVCSAGGKHMRHCFFFDVWVYLYDMCVMKDFYDTGIIKTFPIIVKYMTVHILQNYMLITVFMCIHAYEIRIQITQQN